GDRAVRHGLLTGRRAPFLEFLRFRIEAAVVTLGVIHVPHLAIDHVEAARTRAFARNVVLDELAILDGGELVRAEQHDPRLVFAVQHDAVGPRPGRGHVPGPDLAILGIEYPDLVGMLGGEPDPAFGILDQGVRVLHAVRAGVELLEFAGAPVHASYPADEIAGHPQVAIRIADDVMRAGVLGKFEAV